MHLTQRLVRNRENFKAIINEKDEHGKSLYNRICKGGSYHHKMLQFLSEVGGDLDLLSNFESRVSSALFQQERGDLSRYLHAFDQRV